MSNDPNIEEAIAPVSACSPGHGYYLEFDRSVELFRLNQVQDDSSLTIELNATEAKILCEQLHEFLKSENL